MEWHEQNPDGIPQFGLVAEEVERVNPALVAHDDEGKSYSVRYEAVNAMLLMNSSTSIADSRSSKENWKR